MKIKTRMLNEERRSCIYCGKVRTFSNEHVFPAGLGGDDHRFLLRDLVCAVCNTETFSPLELRFSRSSPAALGRIFFQPTGRGRGKKASIPTIDTRETTVLTENFGAVEAEVTASGTPTILMQFVFDGAEGIGVTGDASIDTADFLAHIESVLTADRPLIVQKLTSEGRKQYLVSELRWNGERLVHASQEVMEKPPKLCVWRELLERGPNGKPNRRPTLFRRRAGQLVLRAPADADVLAMLTRARKAVPIVRGRPVTMTPIENPVVALSMSLHPNDYARVLAKIGVNLVAHSFGEDYVRHHAFKAVKRAILTGDRPPQLIDNPTPTDLFHGVPADRHVAMVHFQKGRAGRFHVALSIRLYGGRTTWLLLADRAIRPPALEAILVVDYTTHHIEEFNNTTQFVMAYPPSPPIEYTRQVTADRYPRLPPVSG